MFAEMTKVDCVIDRHPLVRDDNRPILRYN